MAPTSPTAAAAAASAQAASAHADVAQAAAHAAEAARAAAGATDLAFSLSLSDRSARDGEARRSGSLAVPAGDSTALGHLRVQTARGSSTLQPSGLIQWESTHSQRILTPGLAAAPSSNAWTEKAQSRARKRFCMQLTSRESDFTEKFGHSWWAGGTLSGIVPVSPGELGPNMGWFHRSRVVKKDTLPRINYSKELTQDQVSTVERRRVFKYGPARPPSSKLTHDHKVKKMSVVVTSDDADSKEQQEAALLPTIQVDDTNSNRNSMRADAPRRESYGTKQGQLAKMAALAQIDDAIGFDAEKDDEAPSLALSRAMAISRGPSRAMSVCASEGSDIDKDEDEDFVTDMPLAEMGNGYFNLGECERISLPGTDSIDSIQITGPATRRASIMKRQGPVDNSGRTSAGAKPRPSVMFKAELFQEILFSKLRSSNGEESSEEDSDRDEDAAEQCSKEDGSRQSFDKVSATVQVEKPHLPRRVTGRVRRLGQMCHDKRLAEAVREEQFRRFELLSESERATIEYAFDLCDQDGSNLLTVAELRSCVVELGFWGVTPEERSEIVKLCVEGVRNADTIEKGWEVTRTMAAKLSSVKRYGNRAIPAARGRVNLLELAVGVLPQLRMLSQESWTSVLHHRLAIAGADVSGKMAVPLCSRMVWQEGVDPLMFIKELNALERTPSRIVLQDSIGREGGVAATAATETTTLVCSAHAAAVCRERTLRQLRARERKVQGASVIDEVTFQLMRAQLMELNDSFANLGASIATCRAGWRTLLILLKEFGFVPRGRDERERFDEDLSIATQGHKSMMNFHDFVHFICNRREAGRKEISEQLSKYFDFYDKDRSGLLSMAEISTMLESLNLTPRTREEQEHIRELFLWLDIEGTGKITRRGFQVIYIRMDEHIRQLQYEARHCYAEDLGFGEAEIQEIMDAFDTCDQDGLDTISLVQAKQVFTMLRKSHTYEQVAEALRGELKDSGMVDFAAILRVLAPLSGRPAWTEMDMSPTLTSGGGTGWPEGRTTKFNDADWITPRIIRQALRYMRVPKEYVLSLEDPELEGVIREYLGLDLPPHGSPDEDLRSLLASRLSVHSAIELRRVARHFGAKMESETIEDASAADGVEPVANTFDCSQFPPRIILKVPQEALSFG